MIREVRESTVDLDRLGLHSGQGRQVEVAIEAGAIELGGHTYRPEPSQLTSRLDVSRTVSGYALRNRFEAVVTGPCMRCLEPARFDLSVDAREVDQPGQVKDEQAAEEGESELTSPYVDEGMVDVGHWSRDALVLELPDPILCRSDCAGLCSVCGKPLAGAEPGEHDHDESLDPRWAKLRELDQGGEG